jgi:hypothetical protein
MNWQIDAIIACDSGIRDSDCPDRMEDDAMRKRMLLGALAAIGREWG